MGRDAWPSPTRPRRGQANARRAETPRFVWRSTATVGAPRRGTAATFNGWTSGRRPGIELTPLPLTATAPAQVWNGEGAQTRAGLRPRGSAPFSTARFVPSLGEIAARPALDRRSEDERREPAPANVRSQFATRRGSVFG